MRHLKDSLTAAVVTGLELAGPAQAKNTLQPLKQIEHRVTPESIVKKTCTINPTDKYPLIITGTITSNISFLCPNGKRGNMVGRFAEVRITWFDAQNQPLPNEAVLSFTEPPLPGYSISAPPQAKKVELSFKRPEKK